MRVTPGAPVSSFRRARPHELAGPRLFGGWMAVGGVDALDESSVRFGVVLGSRCFVAFLPASVHLGLGYKSEGFDEVHLWGIVGCGCPWSLD